MAKIIHTIDILPKKRDPQLTFQYETGIQTLKCDKYVTNYMYHIVPIFYLIFQRNSKSSIQ